MLQIVPGATNGAVKITDFDNFGSTEVPGSDFGVDFDLRILLVSQEPRRVRFHLRGG